MGPNPHEDTTVLVRSAVVQQPRMTAKIHDAMRIMVFVGALVTIVTCGDFVTNYDETTLAADQDPSSALVQPINDAQSQDLLPLQEMYEVPDTYESSSSNGFGDQLMQLQPGDSEEDMLMDAEDTAEESSA